jgi:restriction endonuclease S subunit
MMDKQRTPLLEIASIEVCHPFRGVIVKNPEGNTVVIQLRDALSSGVINFETVIKTNIDTKRQPNYLQKGDILFCAKGASHHSVLFDSDINNALCSPHFFLIRLRPNQQIIPDFICWQLNQAPAQKYLTSTAAGSAALTIKKSTLEALPITLPALETQITITKLHNGMIQEQQLYKQLTLNRETAIRAIASTILLDN